MKSFDTTWEDIHKNQNWGAYPAEHVIRFVARNYYKVEDRKKVKILDFGCGGGAHTWYLAREGFDTYAFDGSKSAIKKLKKRLEEENLEVDLRVLDAIEIDYNQETFDAVIDNACIYANTVSNIRKMYQLIWNTLKKGGRLFTSSFSTKTTGYGTGKNIEKNTYTDVEEGNLVGLGIVHFFDKDEIYSILENIGFKNIIVDNIEYTDRGNIVSMYLVSALKE